VALGRALYFDKILSGNMDISCASCHLPDHGTGDGLSVSIGTGGVGEGPARRLASGRLIARNAPPVFHAAGRRRMFWDGRVERLPGGGIRTPEPALNGPNPAAPALVALLDSPLAAQAMFPVTARDEMRGQPGENELADAATNLEVWARLMARLVGTENGTRGGIAGYRALFRAAYPEVASLDAFHFGHAARAIAAFEIVAFGAADTPYDAYLRGDATALTDAAKRGAIVFFGRGNCAACHRGPTLSDDQHHAIGVPQVGPGKDFPGEDTGRALVTGAAGDRHAFRTPPLRNVALTGPWMHDGAFTTLANAVRHYIDVERSLRNYDASQLAPPLRPLVDRDPARQDARARAIADDARAVRISEPDVDELVRFLQSLTDPREVDRSDVPPPAVPSGLPVAD
jgi:cytochrome c peroxidase